MDAGEIEAMGAALDAAREDLLGGQLDAADTILEKTWRQLKNHVRVRDPKEVPNIPDEVTQLALRVCALRMRLFTHQRDRVQ
ncbi:MAG: hypothetical protein MHM6MM_009108, partial [Cercozoa sp. M6MM]